MRHAKCAVFQVTNNHGFSRLICISGVRFSDSTKFEAELKNACGAWLHITFLGRFDQIESATDLPHALDLLLAGPIPPRILQEATPHPAHF